MCSAISNVASAVMWHIVLKFGWWLNNLHQILPQYLHWIDLCDSEALWHMGLTKLHCCIQHIVLKIIFMTIIVVPCRFIDSIHCIHKKDSCHDANFTPLSLWQPTVQPVATKLTSWKIDFQWIQFWCMFKNLFGKIYRDYLNFAIRTAL